MYIVRRTSFVRYEASAGTSTARGSLCLESTALQATISSDFVHGLAISVGSRPKVGTCTCGRVKPPNSSETAECIVT